jgi:hypothetical protein
MAAGGLSMVHSTSKWQFSPALDNEWIGSLGEQQFN